MRVILKRVPFLFCELVIVVSIPLAQVIADKSGSSLPLDLAFSRKTVRRSDVPAVSRDGKMLAYEVHMPPVRSADGAMTGGGSYLPNGMTPSAVGLRLYVVSTRGGEAKPACPERGSCWRPSFSPDRGKLAFYSDADGAPRLWLYDLGKNESRRLSDRKIKVKHWQGDGPQWSPDGREIFVPLAPTVASPDPKPIVPAISEGPTVTIYKAGAESPPRQTQAAAGYSPDVLKALLVKENNASLAAVDVETGAVRIVVPDMAEPRPSNMRVSPDGKWVSYLSVFRLKDGTSTTTYYDLSVAPAFGGKPTVIAADIEVGDQEYFQATYRWRPGTTQIVFLKQKKLWMIDAANPAGGPRQLGPALGNLGELPLLLTRDGSAVLVGVEADGDKTYYSVKPKALALVPLDGSPATTFTTVGAPIEADRDTLWQPDPSGFSLVRNDDKTGQRSIVRVAVNGGGARTLWTGRGRFDSFVMGEGGGLVARYESLGSPPDFYAFSADFSSKQRITRVEPRLDGLAAGTMEVFDSLVPGFDGRLQPVETAVFLPPGKKAGDRLPTIVHFYAGSKMSENAQEYGGGDPNSIPVPVFTSRGYAVLLVDVPLGPQGHGGNPVKEMSDAILAQVYRAADLGYTDIRRVAIMGQSYGGYSTAAILTQTNLFRAAVAMNGVYDLAGNYSSMHSTGANVFFLWSESGQGRMGTHPWADARRYLANSPYHQADKIRTPLLLVHGRNDDTCPVVEAEKMFNALKRLDRTAQLAVYDGEGHVPGEWSLVNAVDVTQRMLDFIGKYTASNEPAAVNANNR
jgi:dipeptidyl aminopeptidase/acylaminoacyl peptidase